uniref:Cystine/glutamate transporter n=1 Tax=Callorhinchus milii TaxID=7868 RepID=A0A4W3HIE0_CALMI
METTGSERITKEDKQKEKTVFLRKKINLFRALSLLIGTIIGSGIFISPKGVLINSGNVGTSLIIWVSCGILSMFGALSYADLGTSIKKSGGHYIYLLETLGPFPAFLRLWVEIIIIRPANTAFVALTFGRYITEPFFSPCQAPLLAIKLVSAVGVSLIVFLNCWSVSWTARIQTIFLFAKLLAIGLIIIPGIMVLFQGHYDNFQNAFDSNLLTVEKLPLAFYAGMFAYSGWYDKIQVMVPFDMISFCRNVPRAIIFSLIIVTILYLLANVAYYAVMTADEVLDSSAVAVEFSPVIPLLVALSCLGAINGALFSTSRMFFVASREDQWPVLFSMIHVRYHTPLPAVLLLYPVILLMIFGGELYALLNFNSFPRWFFMGLVTTGLIRHRYTHPQQPRPFKIPIVIPAIFTIMCLMIVGLSLYSDPFNTGMGCLLTLTGVPVYCLVIRKSQVPACCRKAFGKYRNQLYVSRAALMGQDVVDVMENGGLQVINQICPSNLSILPAPYVCSKASQINVV